MALEETSASNPNSGKTWVKFDEESANTTYKNDSPAVLDAQSVQVTLENNRLSMESNSKSSPSKETPSKIEEPINGNAQHPLQSPPDSLGTSVLKLPEASPPTENNSISTLNPSQLQNVPLSDPAISPPSNYSQSPTIRHGFANGDVIVSILPQNVSLPWITPATFRPELVPEELMAQGLTLTVEDYVQIMSQLVNDHRFTLYNICYKRILMAWISLAFLILLCIMFAGFQHLAMFAAGIAWLLINAAAIFVCMWIKVKLNKNLERCLSRINMQLMKHKIILGVDDRGKLSCHKINLCFIYFDPQECIAKLQQLIEQDSRVEGAAREGPSIIQRMDIEDPDIIITGATNTRISHQQSRAQLLLARYSQRWSKLIIRGGLTLGIDAADRAPSPSYTPPLPPRHIATKQCLCQYIEDHLQYKPKGWLDLCKFWQWSGTRPSQTPIFA